jgi:AbiU2
MDFDGMRKQIFLYLDELETLVYTLEALYADCAVVGWMNQHAPAFFQQHQRLLIDKIFLELAKLFDPTEDRQKNQNFSLKHLMDLTSPSLADRPSLDAQFGRAKKALGNIPNLRNKILCHNDCALGNKNISESLQTIKTSLDEVKILFQMCCEAAHYRFAPNTYPVRTLKNWMSSGIPESADLGFCQKPR